jgi:hypothetical protein
MLKTKRSNGPRLVLVLATLSAFARKLISEAVQRELFTIGYRWCVSPNEQVRDTSSQSLVVNSTKYGSRRNLIYTSFPEIKDESQQVFSGASEVEQFLQAARDAFVPDQVLVEIDGCPVIITAEEIKIDSTTLLNRISQKAAAKQAEIYGT